MFHLYGFMIGLGILSGVFIAKRQATHFGKDPRSVDDVLFWLVIPAVIGARLYHVVTDWHLYNQASLIDLVAVWNGGLGIYGAIIGAIIGLSLYVRKKSSQTITHFFLMLDLLAFGVPVAQAIGRFGNYFNQELYGVETTLPWGLTIAGKTYHPLFLYEAILNLGVFSFLLWLGQTKKLAIGKGQYAMVYVFFYGLIRFWLEFLRIESARPTGNFSVFTVAQYISVGMMGIATIFFWIRRHAPKKEFDITLE